MTTGRVVGGMTVAQAAAALVRLDAVLFDLDGVITDTAPLHAACWKRMLDELLVARGVEPFDVDRDYRRHVDGKPRLDGLRDFLRSRSIDVDDETAEALAARKNELVEAAIARGEVVVHEAAPRLVRGLRGRGVATAVVSSSRNCAAILEASGVESLFDARVDGVVAAELGLAGKPDPATFHEAARRLGVGADRAAVIEDAIAGVEAGRAGGFRVVVGVGASDVAATLRRHGADVVVDDLAALLPPDAS